METLSVDDGRDCEVAEAMDDAVAVTEVEVDPATGDRTLKSHNILSGESTESLVSSTAQPTASKTDTGSNSAAATDSTAQPNQPDSTSTTEAVASALTSTAVDAILDLSGISGYVDALKAVVTSAGYVACALEADSSEAGGNGPGFFYKGSDLYFDDGLFAKRVARIYKIESMWDDYDRDVARGIQKPNWIVRWISVPFAKIFLPRSEPDIVLVFEDGSKYIILGGGPSSGALWGQALALMSVTDAATAAGRAFARNAPSVAELRPYGGPGGGHHVPARTAFTGARGYNVNEALAIPRAELARLGVNHNAISGAQQTLYRAFAQTGKTLTWEAMEEIETQALIKGGMNAKQALATVRTAIQALKNAGVSGPTTIPWGG